MKNVPVLTSLVLAPELTADDLLGLHDEVSARVAAMLHPEGAAPVATGAEEVPRVAALPAHIDRPWQRFSVAAGELRAFRQARAVALADAANNAADEDERAAANAWVDDRWRAFEQWCGGAAGLADDDGKPPVAEARWLYGQLFPQPEGMRFITRRPHVQWNAMKDRMIVLHGERAQGVVAGFHGERHFAQLQQGHHRFGRAYGFTEVVLDRRDVDADGRPQWTAAREALRVFLVKAEGYADPDIEGSDAVSAFLLAPYVSLIDDLARKRRAPVKKAGADATPAAPAKTG